MVDIMQLTHKELGSMKVYEDNDRFFDVLWEKIDKAKDFICIQTYAMDHKNVAGITLQKLRNAVKRGVKVYLIIDDLCYFPNKEWIRQLDAAGGVCIRNAPGFMPRHALFGDRPSSYFQRNHQKVMLVDDNIFCGSLNLANHYTSVRYGDGSFRDLNIILKGHPAKRVRDFFRDILLRNEVYWPEKIKPAEINAAFDEFDVKYAWQEAEAAFPNGWPDLAQEAKLKEKDDLMEEIEKVAQNYNREESSLFLEQTPPDRSEVSTAVLEMIRRAEKNIKII